MRTPRVQRLSLSATGTPASGAIAPAAAVAIDGAGARSSARSRGDGVERVQRGLVRLDRARAPRGRPRPRSDRRGGRRRGSRERLPASAHPMTRGTLKSPALARRRPARWPARRRDRATAATSSGAIGGVAARRRWRSAARRSCRSAAPGRRTRGCRRAGARTGRAPARRARGARARRSPRPASRLNSRGHGKC